MSENRGSGRFIDFLAAAGVFLILTIVLAWLAVSHSGQQEPTTLPKPECARQDLNTAWIEYTFFDEEAMVERVATAAHCFDKETFEIDEEAEVVRFWSETDDAERVFDFDRVVTVVDDRGVSCGPEENVCEPWKFERTE